MQDCKNMLLLWISFCLGFSYNKSRRRLRYIPVFNASMKADLSGPQLEVGFVYSGPVTEFRQRGTKVFIFQGIGMVKWLTFVHWLKEHLIRKYFFAEMHPCTH